LSGQETPRGIAMTKKVKIDDRNRIYITSIVDHTEMNLENGEVGIHPNAISGIIYDPERDYDEIIESLQSHIRHFKMLKKMDEKEEKEYFNEAEE